jgi:hypothetical protein
MLPLKSISINTNVDKACPALEPIKPLSPLVITLSENQQGLVSSESRPRATPAANKTAQTQIKKVTLKSKTSRAKENTEVGSARGTLAA